MKIKRIIILLLFITLTFPIVAFSNGLSDKEIKICIAETTAEEKARIKQFRRPSSSSLEDQLSEDFDVLVQALDGKTEELSSVTIGQFQNDDHFGSLDSL